MLHRIENGVLEDARSVGIGQEDRKFSNSMRLSCAPPGFFRPNEFDIGAFGTFATGLGSGAVAGICTLEGRHGFHLLVPLEICRCQVPRDGTN
jgi:hypothetical protein